MIKAETKTETKTKTQFKIYKYVQPVKYSSGTSLSHARESFMRFSMCTFILRILTKFKHWPSMCAVRCGPHKKSDRSTWMNINNDGSFVYSALSACCQLNFQHDVYIYSKWIKWRFFPYFVLGNFDGGRRVVLHFFLFFINSTQLAC